MGNMQNYLQSKFEGYWMDRPPFIERQANQTVARCALVQSIRFIILLVFSIQLGCASFNLFKKEDDEYRRARNAIEGYEDKEGNWIRPEGIRADEPRGGFGRARHWHGHLPQCRCKIIRDGQY